MDPTIDETTSPIKHPALADATTVTRPVVVSENQSSHSSEAVNAAISEVAVKQLRHLTQDRDNSAIVYTHGDLAKRVSKNPSLKSFADILVKNPNLWQKWVQNEYQQVLDNNEKAKERDNAAAYWDTIKDNFYALLRKLRQKS